MSGEGFSVRDGPEMETRCGNGSLPRAVASPRVTRYLAGFKVGRCGQRGGADETHTASRLAGRGHGGAPRAHSPGYGGEGSRPGVAGPSGSRSNERGGVAGWLLRPPKAAVCPRALPRAPSGPRVSGSGPLAAPWRLPCPSCRLLQVRLGRRQPLGPDQRLKRVAGPQSGRNPAGY